MSGIASQARNDIMKIVKFTIAVLTLFNNRLKSPRLREYIFGWQINKMYRDL